MDSKVDKWINIILLGAATFLLVKSSRKASNISLIASIINSLPFCRDIYAQHQTSSTQHNSFNPITK